jgi:isopentenyldiphosphate isomerase
MEQELLDIVNERDEVIGQNIKENKFRKSLISRNVGIFILDDNEKLLITKRSSKKESFPSRYDLATCGNVKADESYEDAAKREVIEELGIECDLKFLGKIYNEFKENDLTIKYFTGIFLGYYSGEVRLSDELVELKRLSVEEVGELINKNKDLFTPGFVNDFLFVKEKLK